ncbi:hypothetical protein HBI56_092270 [Parastagonospora nodorum]|nr:hypothetical protein HBI10_133790 [Parastagonospora nodorum]KAH4029863.1 hypothetical protein HBI13_033810 [Parastagonospora nodorum]KAH4034103.1 hypothetical protein HBI09_106180 [Parastagonospora nodorum]KAH4237033.1 hypothetical protein HBI06_048320 [Parastagonospora nodorum]KAH4248381.1 hypothetical protein HBI05_018660 [Parastagonospora nodorum]
MDSLIQENISLKAEIARLNSSISAKDADGLDLALQIRFKAHELATMTKTIAMQRALLASQDQEKDTLKAWLESASCQSACHEGSYNKLRAAMARRVQADGERIAKLETEVGDWQDTWMEERCQYEDLLEGVRRMVGEGEGGLEAFEGSEEWVQVRHGE